MSVRSVLAAVLALTVALLLSGALLLITSPPALAHDNVLTGSEPPASAAVATPPGRVKLTFKWRIRSGSPAITVVGPDGRTEWEQSEAGQIDPSGRAISVDLRELGPAGRYQVRYQGVTGRGFPFSGNVEFTLTRPGPATPLPTGGGLPLFWVACVVLLTAAGTVLGVRLGRNP
jgi:hypothetical protein